jgi:tRNA dimethylallyltransferase
MVEAKEEPSDGIVIFVLGTTGVGKSKLAMDLATHPTLFSGRRGEIINADSMQIYSGNLNGAMTARPTPEDHARVPHHEYGCIPMINSPNSENFNVQKYREMALRRISEV